jgi:hypothetical protein
LKTKLPKQEVGMLTCTPWRSVWILKDLSNSWIVFF